MQAWGIQPGFEDQGRQGNKRECQVKDKELTGITIPGLISRRSAENRRMGLSFFYHKATRDSWCKLREGQSVEKPEKHA